MASETTHQLPELGSRLRRREVKRSIPDARLVARIRTGDEQAFDAVFDRYHRPLLAFCRHMLGTREEAEDALQQVFVSAHAHLVSDAAAVELRPWLYAIARNRCLSVLRARRESVPLDDVAEPSADGLAVAAEVEQRQDLRDMLGDLARLPDDQRAALVLSELGALSHDEIAATLGVRRDKVKALVFQAREQLAGLRSARALDCRDIREQLANVHGGALRRGPLRKHLEVCDGCRGFRDEVRHQREVLALLLPVVPSIALKAKIVGAVAASGGAGLPLAGGGLAAAGLAAGAPAVGGTTVAVGGFAAKALIVAAVAGVAGGGYAVVHEEAGRSTKPAAAPVHRTAPAQIAPAGGAASAPAPATEAAGRPAAGAQQHGAPAKQHGAKAKHTGSGHNGRPAFPGAQGLSGNPKAQGLAHRPATVPSHGAKAQANGRDGSKSEAAPPAKGHAKSQAVKPVHPAKPVHSAKPVKSAEEPTAVPDAGNRPETPPGQAKKDPSQ